MEHSAKFYMLKDKWEKGYITKETLMGWVTLNDEKPGKGITLDEYMEIINS